MDEFDKFLEGVNNSILPIANEIEVKLRFLQKFADMDEDCSFKKFTRDDLKD